MNSPIEVATEFWNAPRGCTCGAPDIGVGTMHEPSCGLPSPDDLADLIAQVRREAMQACMEAARAAWNEAGSQPSRSNPPGYDVAAMQAGASIVVDAIECAAREVGVEELKP